MMQENLTDLILKSIRSNWDHPALSDYGGKTYSYADVGTRILRLHAQFEAFGIREGDKVALLGKNSANWGISYLAILTYGAVVVPILPDFRANDIHHIVNHSDSRLLMVARSMFDMLEPGSMSSLRGILCINDGSLLGEGRDLESWKKKFAKGEAAFNQRFSGGVKPVDLDLRPIPNDQLAAISYTSGTTGFTKGVMLPHNSLTANMVFATGHMQLGFGHRIVSFLPLAHAYGCAFEFLWPVTLGCHITFLTKTPSPQIILKAFGEIRPSVVLAVPLIIEKIYKKQILPTIEKPVMRALLKTPLVNKAIKSKIRRKLVEVFGGEFHEIVIGGAALNAEVEAFLRDIEFPFSVGYGMTECGPLISYARSNVARLGSCGTMVDTLEAKIDNPDPKTGVGEIMVRGENVMRGYYKNPEATSEVLDKDGWLRTGDLGVFDKDGFLYIKGRCKTMILGPSGQNIYPEEIEAKLNNREFIQESLVIENKGVLEALVYPDYDATDKAGISESELKKILDQHRSELNATMPAFMKISRVKIVPEEFAKTPKKSIKRFLYTMDKD